MKKFWSIKELAELLGVSKSLLYAKAYRKELPYKRIGRRILIPADYVNALLEA